MGVQVVWFKRDLRVDDHRPLTQAAQNGPVLPLYVIEPAYWQLPDTSARHWRFIRTCLEELNDTLTNLGQPLIVRQGNVTDILETLHATHTIDALWSHMETGNLWTFERDKAVQRWCNRNSIPWHQPRQFGVIRTLKDRNGWAAAWDTFMKEPLTTPPASLQTTCSEKLNLPTANELKLADDGLQELQTPGRKAGLDTLHSFLHKRGENYQQDMSSPNAGWEGCSRLSPHLAYGTLSMREVWQTLLEEWRYKKTRSKAERGNWLKAYNSFNGRLHWHCHFMQKLELDPTIETTNMQQATEALRPENPDENMFTAWQEGRTGYPFVDACMRALTATGWMNFRMRAMLVSFASYHLWQPWQQTAHHLARMFTDYEPGIHYSQVQMQSGTTGINTVRIYNPIKQSQDQDPEGTFIRHWVPELKDVPTDWVHEPWLMDDSLQTKYGCIIGQDYPAPIVDHKTATKQARDKVYNARKSNKAKAQAKKVYEKHGSRKGRAKPDAGEPAHKQQNLFESDN